VREVADWVPAGDVIVRGRSTAAVVGVSFRGAYICAAASAERHGVPVGRFSQYLCVSAAAAAAAAAAEAGASTASSSSLFSLH